MATSLSTLGEKFKFCEQLSGPILTPYPPWVDKRGHLTYPPLCPRRQKVEKSPPPKILNVPHLNQPLPTSSCPRSCWRVPYYNLFHIFCSLFSLNFQRGFMFGGSISFTFWQGMICVLLFRFLRIWLKWFCVASLPTRKVLKDKENRANRIWKRFDHKK